MAAPKQYSFKGKSTIYTDAKRQAMQYNALHDSSVRAATEELRKKADNYLEHLDTLYDMIVAEGLPRYYFVGHGRKDPERMHCRYCGADIGLLEGWYAWRTDPLNHPWKIQCPICQRRFPSNDFGSFYKLGLDQKGVFHPEKAKEEHIRLFGGLENVGYLKNELYPEMDEHVDKDGNLVNAGVHGWGVDDGFGYVTKNAAGEEIRHYYIAFYLHEGIWGGGSAMQWNVGVIKDALTAFRDAYLCTNVSKYARAGAMLLDRIADFYSDYDWYLWSEYRGEDYVGKILDPIWECNLAELFARCYDAFYPIYQDPELIACLREKAKQQAHENLKNSADLLCKNVEDGILRVIYRDAVANKICGNFGMDQSAVTLAAVALNTMPETKEWLDWVMAPGKSWSHGPDPDPRTGANVLPTLIEIIDRDGMGDESAPGYNIGWIDGLVSMADALHGYELYQDADLYKNPKFIKMLYGHLYNIMGGYYSAQVGDCSYFAGTSLSIRGDDSMTKNGEMLRTGLKATGDPIFAQALHLVNGRSAEGLCYSDTYENPGKLAEEVQQIVDTYGEFSLGSTIQAGYGLMALRDGDRTKEKNTLRDFWMYIGSTYGHGHRDTFNIGLDAYGLNMAPEMGYPFDTGGSDPGRFQWVSATISHNTVVVDEQTMLRSQNRGYPLHFDDAGKVKVMDAEKAMIYEQTDIYRRTIVMIEANEDVSYGVDFFRIRGGRDHLYSFHSQSHEIAETEGLALVRQNGGSYAGVDVPYGPDPSPMTGKSTAHNIYTYPDGYTWLDNVEKDLSPAAQFAVDFKVSDYHHVLEDAEGLHLRMTMLGGKPLDEVSIVDGYTVKMAPNPDTNIKYVLARNKTDENGTLFTTVLEPYKGKRYFSGMESVAVTRADGTAIAADETVKAVKVSHTSGRVDYVVYALDNTVEYIVGGLFRFRGFVGVVSYCDGKLTYAYLNDGDLLTDAICGEIGAYTGTVADFTKTFSRENAVEVTLAQAVADISDMVGRCIYVANDGEQNAVYEIKAAKCLDNGNVLLDIGDITLIRKYRDTSNMSLGFVYNIEPGQTFRIPRSIVKSEIQ